MADYEFGELIIGTIKLSSLDLIANPLKVYSSGKSRMPDEGELMETSNQQYNEQGQPIGPSLENWQGCPFPDKTTLTGQYCRLEPVDPNAHQQELFEAFSLSENGANWTYLFDEPKTNYDEFKVWINQISQTKDPLFYTVVDKKSGKAAGVASYLRIAPEMGSIEVGHIHFSPLLQNTPAATEAMFLMMNYTFELGYRRYEWKCDSLNAPSRNAALRLGFTFEGIFRQAVVYKGRSRDTAWFSILDKEWPALQQRFNRWLNPDNFDVKGVQKYSLKNC